MGDTHLPRGSRALPDRCREVLRTASLIVHTGDFTAAAVLRELDRLAPTRGVHGNADEAELRSLLPARLVLEHGGLRIGVVHDAGPRTGRHERLARTFPDCDLVAYGHTHEPEIVLVDGRWIVNPGSPTERRRSRSHAMALIEDGEPHLVEL